MRVLKSNELLSCGVAKGRSGVKYAIVIPDGCADEPQPTLDGKTPLQAARDAGHGSAGGAGVVGRASNVPAHLPAGSDVAT